MPRVGGYEAPEGRCGVGARGTGPVRAFPGPKSSSPGVRVGSGDRVDPLCAVPLEVRSTPFRVHEVHTGFTEITSESSSTDEFA